MRATCLYIATKLGDLMEDPVVVGGLAPSLLVGQLNLPSGAERHVGTTDLDVGLTVALLDEGRYTALSDRLRRAGFAPDENEPDFAALITPGLGLALLDRRPVTLTALTIFGERATRDVWDEGGRCDRVRRGVGARRGDPEP